MCTQDPIWAFILAGGRSSRLGQDKGLAAINGTPLIFFPIQTVKALTQSVYIVGPPRRYRRLGYPVIADCAPPAGPLSGIFTALNHCPTPLSIILACDMPKVPPVLLQTLWQRIQSADAALVRRQNGTVEPLCGIYSTKCLPKIELSLNSSNFALHKLLDQLEVYYLDEAEFESLHIEGPVFENVNTPAQLDFLCKNPP
jgi:molybdenum cofactor guanylyltransferase